MHALVPLKLRWVTQLSIDAAHDEEFLALARRSGCKGVLIGFESLDSANLKAMGKAFNNMRGGYGAALANLHRHGIRVYGTFTFGQDHDREESFAKAAGQETAMALWKEWRNCIVRTVDEHWFTRPDLSYVPGMGGAEEGESPDDG